MRAGVPSSSIKRRTSQAHYLIRNACESLEELEKAVETLTYIGLYHAEFVILLTFTDVYSE